MYRNEVALLKSREVEVIQYEKCNDDISGTLNKIKTTFDSVWSKKTYREISALIKKNKPDIAHFHNIWYLISPSAYYACKDAGVPVVQTLHNFRMFCANGLLLRNGMVCEECVGKLPWRSVLHSCFRSSRLYSIPVAVTEIVHQIKGTWVNEVAAYIALTDFGKQKFIECGLPADRIFVKPNFLSSPPLPKYAKGAYAVYLGRLSQEKGLDVLLDAFQILASSHFPISSFSLKIVGEGPLMEQVKGERRKAKGERHANGVDIEFVGRKSHQECMEILRNAAFLILPSLCYENFPLSIIEAFACGKPVIASRLGAMAAIVEHGKTGLLFETGNAEDLASKMQWMIENSDECAQMGRNARAEFEAKYTADKNYEILMDIYRRAIDCRKCANE